MEFIIENIAELPSKVSSFLPALKSCNLFLIHGEMGVGKTTFVQELLRQMGVSQLEGSPTYSLINNYETESYGKVYHLDLYRLKKLEEAYDIGLEELLEEQALILIEWPDLIYPLIHQKYAELHLTLLENKARKLILTFHG